MGSVTMIRHKKTTIAKVSWVDDVQAVLAGPGGVCVVSAALDYQHADARIVLRHGPNEVILAAGLGDKWSYVGRHTLAEGDKVVLQWRALDHTIEAISEVAELAIDAVADQFAAD